MRILIVEDSARLAESLEEALKKNNFVVDIASDGPSGYELASSGIYDIAILDLMLPGIDGYEILRRLRNDGMELPVIILSAKAEMEDKIEGFRVGADDYMTKPFDIRELIMRILAVSRRINREYISLQAGNLNLDLNSSQLLNTENGKNLQITGKELQLIEILLRNQGQILEKEQLATKIWGYESNAEYNTVEVYISFIRRKLAYLQTNVKIRAVRGVGYILEVPND